MELSFNGHFELDPGDADVLVQLSNDCILWEKPNTWSVASLVLGPVDRLGTVRGWTPQERLEVFVRLRQSVLPLLERAAHYRHGLRELSRSPLGDWGAAFSQKGEARWQEALRQTRTARRTRGGAPRAGGASGGDHPPSSSG